MYSKKQQIELPKMATLFQKSLVKFVLLQINPFYDETQASHPDISRHAFGINRL